MPFHTDLRITFHRPPCNNFISRLVTLGYHPSIFHLRCLRFCSLSIYYSEHKLYGILPQRQKKKVLALFQTNQLKSDKIYINDVHIYHIPIKYC
jgi:hypothetical protein